MAIEIVKQRDRQRHGQKKQAWKDMARDRGNREIEAEAENQMRKNRGKQGHTKAERLETEMLEMGWRDRGELRDGGSHCSIPTSHPHTVGFLLHTVPSRPGHAKEGKVCLSLSLSQLQVAALASSSLNLFILEFFEIVFHYLKLAAVFLPQPPKC